MISSALDEIKSNNPDVIAEYKNIKGNDIDQDIKVSYNIDVRNGKLYGSDCVVTLKGFSGGYAFDPDDAGENAKLIERLKGLIESVSRALGREKVKDDCRSLPAKYHLSIDDFTTLYLVDLAANIIYAYGKDPHTYEYTLTKYYGASGYYSDSEKEISYKDLPNMDNLDPIVLKDVIFSESGRCYESIKYNLYYKPSARKSALIRCGICFRDMPGGAGKTEVNLLPDSLVPTKIASLGLTKGEEHHYELDSSD